MPNHKIVWTEGMFLQQQHFQQSDRYFHRLLETRVQPLRPYPWGVTRFQFDQQTLGVGKLSLTSCTGVFPDGTPFNIPDDDEPPLPLDLPLDAKDVSVMLALPLMRSGIEETDLAGSGDGLARFAVREEAVRDSNGGDGEPALLQLGALRLKLALASEPLGGYTTLAVGRVVERRADGQVVLDANFIPPVLACEASPALEVIRKEIFSLLHHRGEELAARVAGGAGVGVAGVIDFLLLQLVNRYEPLFAHLSRTSGLHPHDLYEICLALAGELATFARPGKRTADFPPYRHEALQATFQPLIDDIRRSLSMVLVQNAVAIAIEERKYGVRVATLSDRQLLKSATFVLAANARVPADLLRSRFPGQVKIGPVEKIRDLVNLALPGIALNALPVAPRQIPFHAGYCYFELDRSSEYWKQLEASGGFAIHVAGEFPELALELWAIRG